MHLDFDRGSDTKQYKVRVNVNQGLPTEVISWTGLIRSWSGRQDINENKIAQYCFGELLVTYSLFYKHRAFLSRPALFIFTTDNWLQTISLECSLSPCTYFLYLCMCAWQNKSILYLIIFLNMHIHYVWSSKWQILSSHKPRCNGPGVSESGLILTCQQCWPV